MPNEPYERRRKIAGFEKRKNLGMMTWTPRRGKWRSGHTSKEIETERQIQRYFERGGKTQDKSLGEGKTQRQISVERHFMRAAQRVGEDERNNGVYRYYDAIHKLVTLSGAEEEMDHHPLLGRLRWVNQTEAILSGYYVAASHHRLEHSLGAMHMAGRIGRALKLPPKTIAELRFAALVHDIGHTAFSHGAEQILKKKLRMNHEELGEKRMKQAKIPKMLRRHGLDFEQIMKYNKGEGLGEIVTDFADRMDYMQRDGLHVGVKPHVQQQVKLTIEEIIRNLRIANGRLCVTPEGENSLKRFADLRTLFYSQIYFYPPSMLTRHFLRKALEIGVKRRVIKVRDLLEGSDEQVLRKLADAKIPEAGEIHLSNTYLRFNPVFTAHLGQLKPNKTRGVLDKSVVKKIQRALEESGLKLHEYYADITPNIAKPISYRILHPSGRVESKIYRPVMPKDERLLFVYALHDKEEQARKAIQQHVEPLTRKPHVGPNLQSGNEKV